MSVMVPAAVTDVSPAAVIYVPVQVMVELRPALVGEQLSIGPTLLDTLTAVTAELWVFIATVKVIVSPDPEKLLGEAVWLVMYCA